MTVAAMRGTERIARAFARAKAERRLAVIIYLTVGYPDRASTPALLRAAIEGGADLIELGVPFSDPLADGATVQRANEVALANGVTLADCLAEGRELVAATHVPDRLARLAPGSRGFIYCVSLTGVTGARRALGADVEAFVERVRAHSAVPIVLGFGISAPSHVAALRGVVDGVAIGSAAIDAVSGATGDRAAALRTFVRGLGDAGRS